MAHAPAPAAPNWAAAMGAWLWGLAARRYFDVAVIAVLIAGIGGINIWWAHTETRPPHWDMARHLWESLLYWNVFQNHQLLPLLQDYHYYPPFVYWVTLPFYKLFGPTLVAAVASNLLFLSILCYSVYAIGRRLGGRATGMLSVLITMATPIFITQFKEYQLDAPLAAIVALACCFLLYSERFERLWPTLGFGLTCGIGMLTKWTFAACLAAPLIVVVIQAARADLRERSWMRLGRAGVALLVGYAICSPWYAANIQQFRIDMKANGAPQALAEGDPVVGALRSDFWYLNALLNQQLFAIGAGLLLIASGLLIRARRRSADLILLVISIVAMYLIFTMLPNKDVRYTMPMLPLLATITAYGILQLRRRRLVFAAVAAVALIQFASISFGTSLLPRATVTHVGSEPITVFAQRGYITGPPSHEDWGLLAMFNRISRQPVAQRNVSYSGDETIWLNGWDLTYYSQLKGVSLTSPQRAHYQLVRSLPAKLPTDTPLMRTLLPDGSVLALYEHKV